jgi:hypothetical protein
MEFFNNGLFNIFDPTRDGTYDFVLSAFSKGTTDVLAQSKIQIIVGEGADDDTQPNPSPNPNSASVVRVWFGDG